MHGDSCNVANAILSPTAISQRGFEGSITVSTLIYELNERKALRTEVGPYFEVRGQHTAFMKPDKWEWAYINHITNITSTKCHSDVWNISFGVKDQPPPFRGMLVLFHLHFAHSPFKYITLIQAVCQNRVFLQGQGKGRWWDGECPAHCSTNDIAVVLFPTRAQRCVFRLWRSLYACVYSSRDNTQPILSI